LTKILAQGGGGTGTTFKSEGIFIFMTYAEKLKDPRWQKKRLEVMQRDDFKCKLCNDKSNTLHVHHKSYQYGKEPWDYELDNFDTLCVPCHELEEFAKSRLNEFIYKLEVLGYYKHQIVKEFHTNVYKKLIKNG
jgi:hypothetical protein